MITTAEDKKRQEKQLRSATAWQKKPLQAPEQAGATVVLYLEQYMDVSGKREPVVAAFREVVDDRLLEYCQPDRFDNGVLYVRCSPGPHLHLLKTGEMKIVEKIRALCPKAKLRAIRFRVKN